MSDIRKKVIISYEKTPTELKELILKKYPDGWVNHTKKVAAPNGAFYAITVDYGEATYLVKMPVKVDEKSEKIEEAIFSETHDNKEDEEVKDQDEPAEDKGEE